MLDRIKYLRIVAAKMDKQVVIGETGWSSQGTAPNAGVASPANQARYFKDFCQMATAHGFVYYWFTAFNSPWEIQNGAPMIEGYFGFFTDKYVMKPDIASLTIVPRRSNVVRNVGSQLLLTQDDTALSMMLDASKTAWLLAEQQTWHHDQATSTLRSKGNGRCLDTYQAYGGGSVHLYACIDNEPNQKWVYEPSTRRMRHGTYTWLCLDTDPAAGNKLQVYGCSPDNKNQQWTIETSGAGPSPTMAPTSAPTPVPTTEAPAPASDGSVRFFTKESLSTHYAQLVRNGGEVGVGYGASGAPNSEWWYNPGNNLVQSKDSNLCLDAYEGWEGGRVHTYACIDGEMNQAWRYDASKFAVQHLKHTDCCLACNSMNEKVLQLKKCSESDVTQRIRVNST